MSRNAWLTPDNEADAVEICRSIRLPYFLWPHLNGAITELTKEYNWESFGTMTQEEAADTFSQAYDNMRTCPMIASIIALATENYPDNVLPCDGAQYQRLDYPNLYDALDPVYQVDVGTFRVPNLNGRFLIAEESGKYDLDATGGTETHTLTVAEMPAHNHTYTPPANNSPVLSDLFGNEKASIGTQSDTGSNGGGSPHNNMPPYYVVRYGIIAK